MVNSQDKLKIVAMIPARLGSQRIPKKNLRLLGGKVLVEWVIDSCKETNKFDQIYINSESRVFQSISDKAGISFYERPAVLSSNSATNDNFALDFMSNVELDVLIQVNPTSPFTTSKDIAGVIDMLFEGDFDTVHTVKEERIEGLFGGIPLNFDPTKQMPPSQELTPVHLFTSSIMAWRVSKFKENMSKHGCAVYGGDGKIGYYPVSGEGSIDIDNEKDFSLAEAILLAKSNQSEMKYYEV
jgi:CMP-N,N'-diacetyllegionaminic acid synthase